MELFEANLSEMSIRCGSKLLLIYIINYKLRSKEQTSVLTHLYLVKWVPYYGTGDLNFGYRDTSFSLALSAVKCQQINLAYGDF